MKRFQKKRTILLLSLALLAGVVVWWLFIKENTNKGEKIVTPQGQTINISPPTPEELKDNESHKDELSRQYDAQTAQSTSVHTNTGTKRVTPVITYATNVQVDAFVPGVYENGGTCTLVATKGNSQFTKQVAAFADATTTQCEHFILKTSNFSSKGTWSVKIRYSSSTSTGESEARLMEVN